MDGKSAIHTPYSTWNGGCCMLDHHAYTMYRRNDACRSDHGDEVGDFVRIIGFNVAGCFGSDETNTYENGGNFFGMIDT